MFFGWGSDTAVFTLPDGRRLECTYRYVSILFIFKLAFAQRWRAPMSAVAAAPSIGGLEASGAMPPVSDPNALVSVDRRALEPLFLPDDPPKLPLLDRFGLVVPALALVALVSVGAWSARGTTTVDALTPGTCFLESSELEVERLATPSCDEPHDSEVIGEIELIDAPAGYPADVDPFWDGVIDRCLDLGADVIRRGDQLPQETYVHFLSPTEAGWARGDRIVICYLHSPDGLVGSFVGGDV